MRKSRKRRSWPMAKGDPTKTKSKTGFTPPPDPLPTKTQPPSEELKQATRTKIVRWAKHHCK